MTDTNPRSDLIDSQQPRHWHASRGLGTWSGRALAALTLTLAACATTPLQQTPAPERHAYSLTVPILATDSQAAVAAAHNAKVVTWHPESGFAVLAVNSLPATKGLRALEVGLEPSRNMYSIAGTSAWAGGTSAWAGGTAAWAGGTAAWAGGTAAWAGGTAAWAGGTAAWAGGWETAPVNSGFSQVAAANGAAWEQVRLKAGQALAPRLGAGVTVAVLDTGVALDHIAFANRLTPPNTWKDFVDGDGLPQDQAGGSNAGYGHGTGVAGAVLQFAPNAKIMPIRVLDPEGVGDSTNIVAAIDWAVRNGADVINMSLGSDVETTDVSSEVRWATDQGVYVVASAGNAGREAVAYPAALGSTNPRVIGVSSVSTLPLDVKSPFSNYGAALDMVGPGEKIWGPAPGNALAWWSGTSVTAPQASGALALAISGDTRQQFAGKLKAPLTAGDDVSRVNTAYAGLLGRGRLNVEKLLKATLR